MVTVRQRRRCIVACLTCTALCRTKGKISFVFPARIASTSAAPFPPYLFTTIGLTLTNYRRTRYKAPRTAWGMCRASTEMVGSWCLGTSSDGLPLQIPSCLLFFFHHRDCRSFRLALHGYGRVDAFICTCGDTDPGCTHTPR